MASAFKIGDRVRYSPKGPALWPQLKGVEGVVTMTGPHGNFYKVQFGPGAHDYILPNRETLVTA